MPAKKFRLRLVNLYLYEYADHVDVAADPLCYATCSNTFGNADCLLLCAKRLFHSGVCAPNQGAPGEMLCCCR